MTFLCCSKALHPALTAMSRLVAGKHFDVLDNHAKQFTHPDKGFEPRIVNRENAHSSLLERDSDYQAPTRRHKKQKKADVVDGATITMLKAASEPPQQVDDDEDMLEEEDSEDDQAAFQFVKSAPHLKRDVMEV